MGRCCLKPNRTKVSQNNKIKQNKEGVCHIGWLLEETVKSDHDCFKSKSYDLDSTFNALSILGCQENSDDRKEPVLLAAFDAATAQKSNCFIYFWVSHQILDSRCWKYGPGLGWGLENSRGLLSEGRERRRNALGHSGFLYSFFPEVKHPFSNPHFPQCGLTAC